MLTMKPVKYQLLYFSILFILTVSLLSHFLYSWIGFNPTDEGFILSLSRRIIDGQFPHRDFIYIRPALSPLIHVPFVYFGGEYTFWISRLFVWIELASVSCIWTVIILHKFFSMRFNFLRYIFFAFACFVFSTYTAFIFAYTTYDALLFYSLGILICFGESKYSRLAGYFVIGLSYLCRQNFLLAVPIALWMFSDLKRALYWIAVLLPGIIYMFLMILLGAFNDFTSQVLSLTGKFHGGFKVYILNPGFWIFMVLGFAVMYVTGKSDNSESKKHGLFYILRWLVYLLIPIASLVFLGRETYPLFVSFSIFGYIFGTVLYLITRKRKEIFKPGIFLLLIGWVTSVSIGMSYPALFSGEYILFIMILVLNLYNVNLFSQRSFRFWFNSSLIILSLLLICGFTYARLTYTYRDLPSDDLNYKIEDELNGTKNIKTNINTYMFLKDLKNAVSLAGGRTYCILPDLSAYWVKSQQENPLPVSWGNKTELNNEVFNDKIKDEIKSKKGLVFIMQKVYANSIQRGNSGIALEDSYSPIIPFVKMYYRKLSETQYFELYE